MGSGFQPPQNNYPPSPYGNPQQPNSNQQPMPPPHNPSFWTRKVGPLPLWVFLLILVLIGYLIFKVLDHPAPRGPLVWTTTHTFKGRGNSKTPVFSVLGDWRVGWTCDPSSASYGMYNLSLDADKSDGTTLDHSMVNAICEASNTHDETEEQQHGGNVYLDIQSGGSWVITVQELE